MRYITRTFLSIFCALALMLAPAGAHAADTLADAMNACDAGEIERLFKGAAVRNTDPEGNTYLHYAVASCDSAEIVNILVSAGANINAKSDTDRLTALHQAIIKGHVKSVVGLLRARADVNAKDIESSTPLHQAAFVSPEIVAVLIRAGARVNAKDADGLTPLHIAAFGGQTDIVKLLIKAGADTKAKDKGGASPLMYAVFGLSLGAAFALLFP